jgi:general secretion pathway protein K
MRKAPHPSRTGSLPCPAVCRNQAGMALVLVLWVITLLAVIAASFTLGMRREAGTIRHVVEVAEARAIAETGVRFAMLGLLEDDEDLRWQADGSAHEFRLGEATLTVRVRDEAGRVNINSASPELIEGLLLSAGLGDAGEREALRDNILDWRDPSPHRRGAALSEAQYRAAGLDYGPRNGPFLAVEELLLVPGMAPGLYRRLLPLVTINSGQAGVNPASARREVLMALPGADPALVDAYLEERETAREQGMPPPPFGGEGFGGDGGITYSVESLVRLPSGLQQGIRAVMVLETSTIDEPYRIIHYRPEGSS